MSASCPVFGLIIRLQPALGVDPGVLLRGLSTELLDSRGLIATVPGPRGDEIVITGDGFQATDADREAIVGWLSGEPRVARYEVSPLGDVGHAA